MTLPLLLLAGLGCADKGDDSGLGSTAGIALIDVDVDTLADLGMEVWTYAITEEHALGYRDNVGGDPEFYVVRPKNLDAGRYGGVLYLHGGVGALDGDPDYGELCTPEGIEEISRTGLLAKKVLISRLAQQRRVLIVPVSTWCDLWAGLGPDDPVDPNHKSMLHALTVVQAFADGLDGLRLDTDDYGIWGMSIGGLGAFPIAAELEARGIPPQAIVSDSGPVRMLEMYTETGGMPLSWLDHFFGGPPTDAEGKPTEFWDNYARVDGPERIRSQGFRLPVFSVYNLYDEITAPFHGQRLGEALGEAFAPLGIRDFSLDAEHHGPDAQYHTQTTDNLAPLTYLTDASLRFLQGQELRYREAEELCETGCTMASATLDPDKAVAEALRSAVQEDAILRRASEGPGILFEGPLPADIPRELELRAAFAVTSANVTESSDEPILYVELLDGETVRDSHAVSEIALSSVINSVDLKLIRMNATTLLLDTATLAELAEPRLRLTTTGTGDLMLDGVYFSWRTAD